MTDTITTTNTQPKTYQFQGLEVSKPTAYKSLNSSSAIYESTFQNNENDTHEHHAIYTSLISQLSKLFLIS